jgi:hypothetical protein
MPEPHAKGNLRKRVLDKKGYMGWGFSVHSKGVPHMQDEPNVPHAY